MMREFSMMTLQMSCSFSTLLNGIPVVQSSDWTPSSLLHTLATFRQVINTEPYALSLFDCTLSEPSEHGQPHNLHTVDVF